MPGPVDRRPRRWPTWPPTWAQLDLAQAEELARLAPFGHSNAEPLVALPGVQVQRTPGGGRAPPAADTFREWRSRRRDCLWHGRAGAARRGRRSTSSPAPRWTCFAGTAGRACGSNTYSGRKRERVRPRPTIPSRARSLLELAASAQPAQGTYPAADARGDRLFPASRRSRGRTPRQDHGTADGRQLRVIGPAGSTRHPSVSPRHPRKADAAMSSGSSPRLGAVRRHRHPGAGRRSGHLPPQGPRRAHPRGRHLDRRSGRRWRCGFNALHLLPLRRGEGRRVPAGLPAGVRAVDRQRLRLPDRLPLLQGAAGPAAPGAVLGDHRRRRLARHLHRRRRGHHRSASTG